MPSCKKCSTPLDSNKNWRPSFVRKAYYLCSPCAGKHKKVWAAAHTEHVRNYHRAYIKGNRIRKFERTRHGHKWSISKEEHAWMVSLPCYYCRGPLNPSGSGLDRVDSNGDYTIRNTVPCCGRCNRMKSDLLTVDEMLLLWAIRRGDLVNPLEDEHFMPDGMNWAFEKVNDAP